MEIRVKNIGPAEGEITLGEVDAPGVWFVVGHKAAGKSHLGRLFAALRDSGALRAEASITDGADSAFVEFTPRRVTFTKGPGGEMREPVFSGEGEFPSIAVLPPSIETLITGDNIEGEEARARRRLGALLAYAPISSTREIAEELCGVLENRAFSNAEAPLCAAWNQLAQESKAGGKKAVRLEPLRTAESIRSMVLARERRGVLEEQEYLLELLNATGNTGERAAVVQARKVAEVEGKLSQSFHDAMNRLGWDASREEELKRLFRQEHDLPALRENFQEAKAFAARVQESHASKLAEERRRQRLLEKFGDERPSTERQEEKVARIEEALAEKAKAVMQQLKDSVRALEVTAFLDREPPVPRWGASLIAQAAHVERNVKRLLAAVELKPEESPEAAESRRELLVARGIQGTWDRMQEQLQEPLEGPSEAQLTLANQEAEQAAEALLVAELADAYQAIVVTKESAVRLQAQLENCAKAYRDAAKDSWKMLGAVVTEELKLPWLQVDGLEIHLGYDSEGKLNSDPAVVQEAERRARAALTGASARFLFLGRVRQESPIEWRKLDDPKRVSTAELHEACLEIALSRRERLGPYLWIDWQVMAAFDEASLLEFDRKVSEAGMYVFSERPRRKGDPEELCLERVGA